MKGSDLLAWVFVFSVVVGSFLVGGAYLFDLLGGL